MARIGLRLNRTHQYLIYCTFAVLFASGAVWLVQSYGLASADSLHLQSSSLAPLMMKIHGAAAMVALLLLGSLALDHVYAGWKVRKNHQSGIPMVIFNVLLILSAYGLYYFGDDIFRSWASYVHSIVGLVLFPVFIFHVRRGLKIG